MRIFSSLVVVLGLCLSAGCGGSDFCGDKGKCANDTAPTDQDKAACEALISGSACGSKAKDYGQCYENSETCDTQGNADFSGANTQCTSQAQALQDCCAQNASDPACG